MTRNPPSHHLLMTCEGGIFYRDLIFVNVGLGDARSRSECQFVKKYLILNNIHTVFIRLYQPLAVFIYRFYWVYVEDEFVEFFAVAIDFVNF